MNATRVLSRGRIHTVGSALRQSGEVQSEREWEEAHSFSSGCGRELHDSGVSSLSHAVCDAVQPLDGDFGVGN